MWRNDENGEEERDVRSGIYATAQSVNEEDAIKREVILVGGRTPIINGALSEERTIDTIDTE